MFDFINTNNSQIQGEQKLSFNLELNRTLQKINNPKNPANLDDGIKHQHPPLVDALNQVILENPGDDALRRQPPPPLPQEFYKGNVKFTYSNGPLRLPPLPQGHTFVVTSSLMQMLTARGLYTMLPSEYPHAHIIKLRSACKSCVVRPDMDMDIIGLSVVLLSLTRDALIWFTELPYNSIYDGDQFR